MQFEVDFLPVGEQSKAGDAIVVKYDDPDSFYLMVIDGGTIDSGQKAIEHIRKHHGPNAIIANALLTHSDIDHACGFREIVRELDVRRIWMHRPWEFAANLLPYYADKRLTVEGLKKRLRTEYDVIADIESIAIKRNIRLEQPFAQQSIGPFRILSPNPNFYELLIPQFDKGPDPDQAALEQQGIWIGQSRRPSNRATKWVSETWDAEGLRDGETTSAMNESSVVLYGDFGNSERILLTGDAGPWALYQAVLTANSLKLPLRNFSMIQVPHHGSRSNVGPSILNDLIGPILPRNAPSNFSAYVSAPKDDETHPRRIVLNAFIRRGGRVLATQGSAKCYTVGYPFKNGYSGPATPISFESRVEEYD
jgi:beta-lactamase superfamily II metal-dependent hydrolase